MLSQFEIGHIKGAFEFAGECELSEKAKQKIAYCRKLIKNAEGRMLVEQAGRYARVNGDRVPATPEEARAYFDKLAGECARIGTTE